MSSIRQRIMRGNPQLIGTATTTNATATSLNPKGGYLQVDNNTTIVVEAMVSARRTDVAGEGAGYVVRGAFRKTTGGSIVVVGAVQQTFVAEDQAAWNATLVADTTNGGVQLQVTGEAGKTIAWRARFEANQA